MTIFKNTAKSKALYSELMCIPHLVVKNPSANAGDLDLIPGSGRSPGEGNGNPLEYSCLGNPMDRGAWQGCKESDTRLSD